jgi:hypothetical protein
VIFTISHWQILSGGCCSEIASRQKDNQLRLLSSVSLCFFAPSSTERIPANRT